MAGYSSTPLPKKLGIKESHRIVFLDAPSNFDEILGGLPSNVKILSAPRAPIDLAVLFVISEEKLWAQFEKLATMLSPAGMLWIAWPKKASGVETDLNETIVRSTGLAVGLVDNKVCAIDDTWSGLRFVIRVKDRKKA
jgi:hypothetical protein